MNTLQREIKVRPALSKQDRERLANRQRATASSTVRTPKPTFLFYTLQEIK